MFQITGSPRSVSHLGPTHTGPAFFDMEAHRARLQQSAKDRDAAQIALLRKFLAICGASNSKVLFRAECVGKLASMLAWFYGMSAEYCGYLEKVAPLCEIGALLRLGEAPDCEWRDTSQYALQHEAAVYLLRADGMPMMEMAQRIAAALYEKFDGSGAPRSLHGGQIPLEGRIVALVRCFDRVAQDRTRHGVIHDDETCAYFKRESGNHFDPTLVDILLNEWAAFMALRDAVRRSQLTQLLISYGGGDALALQEFTRLTSEQSL